MTKLMLALFVFSSISSFASESKVELRKQIFDKKVVITKELNNSIVALNTLNITREQKTSDGEFTASNVDNSTRKLKE